MTNEQKQEFGRISSTQKRAAFLLDIGVTAKIDIANLTPVMKAFVGDFGLPITGPSEADAIAKGTAWLEDIKNRDSE